MTRKTSAAAALVARRAEFQDALLTWYRRHRRRLPWREAPSLYRTVVSEFMLQQTQIRTVLPYFERWMAALPDFAALAAAPEARVLKLWEGLGYYSRARNLHRLGRAVAALPAPPRTAAAWRELPGVGPYTSAAIASIAQGEPVACVDGNVVRILARLTGDGTEFRDSASAAKAFTPLAEALVNAAAPGDHNQAMMELGATVCLKHAPACLVCPVRPWCRAAAAGDPAAYPRLAPKRTEQRHVLRVWCERRGALLLHRAAAGSKRLAGLHELPTPDQAGVDPARAAAGPLLAKRTRGITRYRITESIHAVSPPNPSPTPGRAALVNQSGSLVWVSPADLAGVTLSGPHRRWVTEILSRESGPGLSRDHAVPRLNLDQPAGRLGLASPARPTFR
jgi:A/G-specific adenine glycosylase